MQLGDPVRELLVVELAQFARQDRQRHLANAARCAVVAVDYPLTTYFAPGKPLITDVVNQPGDVSFLITEMLKRQDLMIDPKRIAVAGLKSVTTDAALFSSI